MTEWIPRTGGRNVVSQVRDELTILLLSRMEPGFGGHRSVGQEEKSMPSHTLMRMCPCYGHLHKKATSTTTWYLHQLRRRPPLRQVRARSPAEAEAAASSSWGFGERVQLQWPSGRAARMHVVMAQAYIRLLCIGPCICKYLKDYYLSLCFCFL